MQIDLPGSEALAGETEKEQPERKEGNKETKEGNKGTMMSQELREKSEAAVT